jgi:hypothetical protein
MDQKPKTAICVHCNQEFLLGRHECGFCKDEAIRPIYSQRGDLPFPTPLDIEKSHITCPFHLRQTHVFYCARCQDVFDCKVFEAALSESGVRRFNELRGDQDAKE